MRRTGKANVLTALIDRETNCRGTHDHNLLTSYAEDASVMSCNQTKECELPGSPRSTFLVCFSPDKTKMASSHGDHTVRIVDCKTFKCMNTLRGHPRTPWCIAFHPSSNELLASGCLGGEVRVWNLKTGDSEVYTPPDRAVIASLAFHPMDHVLLIATSNKLLLWSWDQPEPFACVQTASAEEKVRLVEFSPLGDHILTAVTNIPQPASNSGTIPSSRSSVVNRLLQSVGNSRMAGNPFASYVLRPSASNSSTSSSTSTSSPSTGLNAIPEASSSTSNSSESMLYSNSVPVTRETETISSPSTGLNAIPEASSSTSNSSESMLYSNSVPVTRETETISSSVINQNDNENQDYRGAFAVFRARDNNTWNFNVTSDDNDSAVLENEATGNSVSFESDSSDDSPGGVSMSVTAGDTDVYSDTPDVELPTMQQSVPFDSQYFTSAPADQPDDRVVGVGRVINVGPSSSRSSYLSHGSNHSSSFATLGGSQGSGTAVATATARTFRHVHTAVVVADVTNGGPQFALRTAINRAIAGAFAGCGEGAVASNIINTTHRLQWWNFSQVELPDLKNSESHVIASSCKIHNDASCDISSDGKLLATFVPSAQGFPDDGVVAVYSLEKATLGQCLFAKEFGPNAISISLSPLNRYIMVGLAARRLHWHLTSRQVVAQIFRLTGKESPSDAVKPVVSITHDCNPDQRSHVSVNAAFFHPLVGNGLVYGTNRGHLHMRQFGRRSSSGLSSLSG